MADKETKGAMSRETEKKLDEKLKFANKWVELADGKLIQLIDNKLLNPLMMKLKTPEEREEYRKMIAEVIDEMPVIEI